MSPSTRIGTLVASAMNSMQSSVWVHDASLQSRTPRLADIVNPLAQMPSNPASSTIRALKPLCASARNARDGDSIRARRRAGRSFVSTWVTAAGLCKGSAVNTAAIGRERALATLPVFHRVADESP